MMREILKGSSTRKLISRTLAFGLLQQRAMLLVFMKLGPWVVIILLVSYGVEVQWP